MSDYRYERKGKGRKGQRKGGRVSAKEYRDRGDDSSRADVWLSKALSSQLRHRGLESGLVFAKDGYTPLIPVMEMLSAPGKPPVTLERVQKVVAENGKQRFRLTQRPKNYDPYTKSGEGPIIWHIRANQGHSFKDADGKAYLDEMLLLTEILDSSELPEKLLHGTDSKIVDTILETGLNKMARDHIHLALGMVGDSFHGEKIISGMRPSAQAIIEVDTKMAMEGGVRFFISDNGVVLSSGIGGVIPPEYLSVRK